jgi:hypothetical protein
MELESQPTQPDNYQEPKIENVGEEFIKWAEKYWRIDVLMNVENPDNFAGETCNYKYMREVFIEKINELVKQITPKI